MKIIHRFIVELENNHHYIIVDTVTGSSYFTPAQVDANALANMLNRYEEKLTGQKVKLNNYQKLLDDNNLVYVRDRSKGECRECKNAYITFLTDEGEVYCSVKDDVVSVNSSCKSFVHE